MTVKIATPNGSVPMSVDHHPSHIQAKPQHIPSSSTASSAASSSSSSRAYAASRVASAAAGSLRNKRCAELFAVAQPFVW